MKRTPLLFFAGVLMSALCVGFVGCNEPNGQEHTPKDIGVAPVPESDVPKEVSAFFEKNLPASSYSGPAPEFDFGDVDRDETVCVIIDNPEEFETIASPSIELPEIDFTKFTLVIGQHSMGNPGFRLEAQGMGADADPMELSLIYKELEGGSPEIVTTFYFWGLYSKLPRKPINVSVYKK